MSKKKKMNRRNMRIRNTRRKRNYRRRRSKPWLRKRSQLPRESSHRRTKRRSKSGKTNNKINMDKLPQQVLVIRSSRKRYQELKRPNN